MSAYAHQMERQLSAQSLSSRGDSEMESRYMLETGFYMTSFAATIFIGGLITVGVLLITLLVALTVMLQSCQNHNSGVVKFSRSMGDYDYCKIFAFHAELNGLKMDEYPRICRGLAIQYVKEGEFTRDLNFTVQVIEGYFGNIMPRDDGLDVVLMDADDILSSAYRQSGLSKERIDQCGYTDDYIEEAKYLKNMFTLRLFMKLQAIGWPMIVFSRKSNSQRNATAELLLSAGYRGWSALVMRSEDEIRMDSHEYLYRRRSMLQNRGFRMISIISSRMDALTGQSLGKKVFKLPNPLSYNFENHCHNKYMSSVI